MTAAQTRKQTKYKLANNDNNSQESTDKIIKLDGTQSNVVIYDIFHNCVGRMNISQTNMYMYNCISVY